LKGSVNILTSVFFVYRVPIGVNRHNPDKLLNVINRKGDTSGSIMARILIRSRFEAKKATATSITEEATSGLYLVIGSV